MSIVPNSQLPNPYVRLLVIVFSFGVALGSGLGYGFSKAVSNTGQQELSAQTKLYNNVSPVKYERLQIGMSLTDAQAILGSEGTEIDKTATTTNFVWKNSNGYKITANFENNKLKSKKQE